jgi:hypothetical protein
MKEKQKHHRVSLLQRILAVPMQLLHVCRLLTIVHDSSRVPLSEFKVMIPSQVVSRLMGHSDPIVVALTADTSAGGLADDSNPRQTDLDTQERRDRSEQVR